MKKNGIYSTTDEIRFLFEDVIKINVLTHAKAFRQHTPEQFLEAVQQAEKFAADVLEKLPKESDVLYQPDSIKVPDGFGNAWKQLSASGILEMLIPGSYGGRNFPETVKVAIQEILFIANPSFYYFLMLTLEVANLIERLGSDSVKQQYCQKLFTGEWSGTFSITEPLTDSDWEAIEATAKEENGDYLINATKMFTVAGSHQLTNNVVHLVLCRFNVPDSKNQQLAWFVTPHQFNGIDNNVGIESCHEPIGLKEVPFCTVSFGKKGPSKGHLLCITGEGEKDLYKSLNGIRSQLALQGVALAGQVFQETLQYASLESNSKNQSKKKTAPLITYPHIADHIMYMKAVTEASRAAVYSIAFFSDCSIHGGEEQQEFFSDLTDIYTGILKVHASQSGLTSISRAVQVFGKLAYTQKNITGRSYRNLQAATLFGGANDLVAQELLDRIVHHKKGSMIDHLIKQFGSVEVNEARSEPMKEAIRVWQDYIGGIIVLVDDLKKGAEASQGSEEVDPRLSSLWADRIVKLVGDVIYCYHLINQGMEAEKKLEQKGVNFYNLQQDVSRDLESMAWYDRLLTAEYFALNVLSENESNIRIIQRNASSALEAFFSMETE